jgi:hypothetical protein
MRRAGKIGIVAGSGLAVLAVVAAVNGGSGGGAPGASSPSEVTASALPTGTAAAKITGCVRDRTFPDMVNVTGTYRAAESASTVTITGEVLDRARHRVGEIDALTNNLHAGQVWRWEAAVTVTRGTTGRLSCRITDVSTF